MSTTTSPIYVVQFVDGVERNRQNPETFSIPDEQAKWQLALHDLVKVGLAWEPGYNVPAPDCIPAGEVLMIYGEKFWVSITDIRVRDFPGGKTICFSGVIANELLFVDVHGFRYGDGVHFADKHILAIQK